MSTKGKVERKVAKVVVEQREAVVAHEKAVVVLDDTNARELIAKFEKNKNDKAVVEAEYKALQAEIYALLGYKKVGDKWIGVAEQGTIEGVAVVKVSTQTRNNFQKEKFLQANPELLELVEKFTEENSFTRLDTIK